MALGAVGFSSDGSAAFEPRVGGGVGAGAGEGDKSERRVLVAWGVVWKTVTTFVRTERGVRCQAIINMGTGVLVGDTLVFMSFIHHLDELARERWIFATQSNGERHSGGFGES